MKSHGARYARTRKARTKTVPVEPVVEADTFTMPAFEGGPYKPLEPECFEEKSLKLIFGFEGDDLGLLSTGASESGVTTVEFIKQTALAVALEINDRQPDPPGLWEALDEIAPLLAERGRPDREPDELDWAIWEEDLA